MPPEELIIHKLLALIQTKTRPCVTALVKSEIVKLPELPGHKHCLPGGIFKSQCWRALTDDETSSHYIFLFMLLLIPFLVIGLSIKANIKKSKRPGRISSALVNLKQRSRQKSPNLVRNPNQKSNFQWFKYANIFKLADLRISRSLNVILSNLALLIFSFNITALSNVKANFSVGCINFAGVFV